MLKRFLKSAKRQSNKVVSILLSLYIILGPVLSISASEVFAAEGDHPQVTITSPSDGSYVNGVVNITGTVDDPNDDLNFFHIGVYQAGEDTWNFSLDDLVPDVTISHEVINDTLYSWDTSSFADGNYLIRVAAVDDAGNKHPMAGSGVDEGDSVKIIPVTVDHTMPTVDITSHIEGEYLNGNEAISGIVNDTNLLRYYFVVKDSEGHEIAGPKTVYNDGPIVNPSFVWDTTTVPNGNYQLVLSARDKADNKQDPGVSTEIVNVKVLNLQKPVIVFPNEGDAFNTTPILNDWTDSAFAPGILKYVVEYDYDDHHSFSVGPYRETTVSQRNHVPNVSEEGGVRFRVKAVANPGNESEWSEWRHYNYDITKSSTVFNTPTTDQHFNSAITVSGTSTDNVGVDFVSLFYKQSSDSSWIKISDITNPEKNTPFNWSYDWTPSTDGTFDLMAYATDKAGNVETTAYVTGIVYDATAPAVPALVSPADGAYIKPSLAMLDWTDVTDPNGHGPVKYNYRSSWVGGSYGPVSTGSNSIINATASPYRTYQWQVQACDSFGNCSAWSGPWTVTIDGAAPTTPHWTNTSRLTQNGDYAYTSDKVRMDMQFTQSTDNFAVHHYDYQFVRADLNGNKLQSGQVNMNSYLGGVSCASGICTWKPDLQDNNQWIFRMRAVDNAGNTSAWSNWNGASDSQFYNFSFDYDDFKNSTGIFARSDYNGASGNGSYVVRENVNPVSEITSSDLGTNDPNIVINYTTSDEGTEVKRVGLYNGDDTLLGYSTNGTFNYTITDGDGTYCFYTRAEDVADDAVLDLGVGNVEEAPSNKCDMEVRLDTIAPTVAGIHFALDFNPYLRGQGFAVSANVSDSFSGIDGSSCEFTYDGGANWEPGTYAMGKCIDFESASDDELLNVNVRVMDNYGNVSTGTPKIRTSDVYDPDSAVSISNLYYGPNTYNFGVIKGTATDSTSDVESLQVTIRRSSDGRYWRGGSWCSLMTCFLGQFRNVSTAMLPAWTYGGLFENALSDGVTYTVTPYATDSVGHIGQGTSDAFTWDETAPINPTDFDTAPNVDGYTSNTTITVDWPDVNTAGSAYDALSGVAGYSFRFTKEEVSYVNKTVDLSADQTTTLFTVPEDGEWYFHIRTVDNVGNWSNATHVGPFIIDTVAPDVEITSPVADEISGIVDVRGTVTDANPHHYWFVIQSVTTGKYLPLPGTGTINEDESFTDRLLISWNTNLVPNGNYRIKLEARDSANNKDSGSIHWKTVTVNNPVEIPTLLSPSDESLLNTPDVTMTWSAITDVNEPITYVLNLDGVDMPAQTGTSYDGTGLADGSYSWKVKAIDGLGNESEWSETWEFDVDATAPTNPSGFTSVPDINDPSQGTSIKVSWMGLPSEEVEPSFVGSSASDNFSGVDGFSYIFSQNSVDTPDTIKDLEEDVYEVDQGSFTDGVWYFHLRTVDNAGNWSSPVSYGPIILDNEKPVITLTGNSTITMLVGGTYTDQGATALDNYDGDITSSIVTVNGVNTSAAGTYEVSYNVTDSAGNVADEVVRTVIVNNPPVVPAVQGAQTQSNDTETEDNDNEEDTNIEDDNTGDVLGALTCDTKQSVSGYVYEDKNGNGKKDENEKGIEGVKVEVKYTDNEGNTVVIDTITTDEDGRWTTELCPAEYKINLKDSTLPENYKLADGNVLGVQIKAGENLNNANIALEKESMNWDWRWLLIILALILAFSGGTYLYYKSRKSSMMNA